MRSFFAATLLVILPSTSVLAKPHCTFRLHCEANAHDGDVFSTKLVSKFTGRPVVIEKTASVTEFDVAAFYPVQADDGTLGAVFQLDDHGRLALDTLSVEHRGGDLFVFINGRPITELQIDRRISDGKVYVPSGLTTADIASMRKDWRMIGQRKK
ncbi:MAG: hypothetical protein ACJ8IQ_01075 [Chthoniobacterales bacterium]